MGETISESVTTAEPQRSQVGTDAPLGGVLRRLRADSTASSFFMGRAERVAIPEAGRALAIAGLYRLGHRHPILVVVPTEAEAERLHHDLGEFIGPRAVSLFPAWETLPFERMSPSVETMGRRSEVTLLLGVGASGLDGGADAEPSGDNAGGTAGDSDAPSPGVIIAPIRALIQRLAPSGAKRILSLRPEQRIDRDQIVVALARLGYRREYQVEARGEFAVRGSIIDIYPSTAQHPVRIDMWDDEIERIDEFAVADQRRTYQVDAVHVAPAREVLLDADMRERARALIDEQPWGAENWQRLADGEIFDGMESWLPWLFDADELLTDRLPKDGLILLCEPGRLRDRAEMLADEERDLARSLAVTWGAHGEEFPRLSLPFGQLLGRSVADVWTSLSLPDGPDTPTFGASAFERILGDLPALVERLTRLSGDGYRVLLAADGEGSSARMRRILGDENAIVTDVTADQLASESPTAAGISTIVAPLERGVVMPAIKLAIIAESDLTGRRNARRRRAPRSRADDAYDDLKPGDFVVHQTHGVGRYEGMIARAIGGGEKDYFLVAYRGGDKLYVPTENVDAIRRYTGGDSPALNRMGGSDFARQKAKVRAEVQQVADELVELYKARQMTEGFAHAPDNPWQHEFEEAFPFEETPDQLAAIEAVKDDMESPKPMDRLVCGDVGYGKTEVAIRAAFKSVQNGKQVAVLVPTTILARQHGEVFRSRFAAYPVNVEVLSRFATPADQRRIVRGLADGSVDVVIGTHRLLSQDIAFANLGLLVVDEEQRFGVQHKERIKQFRTAVDVLTLTATPIPRTLELSLTGIRDLSLVNTPPEGRQPILTFVGPYDDRAVAEAIRRELLREGQVFFIHNRVADIEHVARDVAALVPEARVAVAHGQMDEQALEQVVLEFADREYDVLVCTTIVENGIDMPTVNTMVVDRADALGLAQLYQLRGRVGRSGQRAYAYLFHPRDRKLTEEAYERLKVIGEFTDLGSGYKIAMRDLEMRGAGNLLSQVQSGHIAAVGFDLYCQLVTEAVAERKGEPIEEHEEITLDLPLDAHIPKHYIEREDLRVEAYRRLSQVESTDDIEGLRAEWQDRYGPLPSAAEALLIVARLRLTLRQVDIRELSIQRDTVRMSPLHLSASRSIRLQRLSPKAMLKPDGQLAMPVPRPERRGKAAAVGAKKPTPEEDIFAIVEFLELLFSDDALPTPEPVRAVEPSTSARDQRAARARERARERLKNRRN